MVFEGENGDLERFCQSMVEQVCLSNKNARSTEWYNENNEKTKRIKNVTLKTCLDYTNPYRFSNGIKTKSSSMIKGGLYFNLSTDLILW